MYISPKFHYLAVVGQLDVGRQLGVDFGMAADVVAAVDEPGLTGSYAMGKADGIVEGLVAVMGLLAKGIDNEGVTAQDVGQLVVADGLHVGDVNQGGMRMEKGGRRCGGDAVAEDG